MRRLNPPQVLRIIAPVTPPTPAAAKTAAKT
jgi:hypothetical protein